MEVSIAATDVEAYLREHEQKELVRFVTVGSVDDGKSTLIGRLLYDTHGIYDDQLAAVVAASRKKESAEIDFSLLTDGLRAEREQGITIDVAYRYFTTKKRKFIIADTPGHEEYTRNMATGASTADIAVILLDARLGVLPQSRRHAAIASLLGIRSLVVSVNKMDLVDYKEERYRELVSAFREVTDKLVFDEVTFVPLSAKKGDNVVDRSASMPWYEGPTLLGLLETLPVVRGGTLGELRFPVQYVLRPHLDYRGFAGTLAEGTARLGDEVEVLPSRRRTRIEAIDTFEGSIAEASAPTSVVIRLEDEVDVSRGDILAHPGHGPTATHEIEATLVWLSERAFDRSRALLLKHTTRLVPARIIEVLGKVSLETLELEPADRIQLNDIVRVKVRTARPLFVDPYRDSRAMGAFVVIDARANGTIAAGMIRSAGLAETKEASEGTVTAAERAERLGFRSAIARVDASVAALVERRLFERGVLSATTSASDRDLDALMLQVTALAATGLVVLVTELGDDGYRALGMGAEAGRIIDFANAASAEDVAEKVAAIALAPAAIDPGGGI